MPRGRTVAAPNELSVALVALRGFATEKRLCASAAGPDLARHGSTPEATAPWRHTRTPASAGYYPVI
jgi:hypothetical protein